MEHHPSRPPLPAIPAPSPFSERRRTFRREEDLTAHEERALLARSLDVLAGPGDAETHVAEILALVARVVRARRAAIVTDRPIRRVLVGAEPGEDTAEALELAAWLDARAARPAAVRAAAAPAEIAVVRARRNPAGLVLGPPTGALIERFLRLDVPGAKVQLGLELVNPDDGESVAARLPAATLRHVLAALAAATGRAADEAERITLRARERERERFVSMVAHELRTPLAGLGGYLDLLAGGAVDDPEIGHEFVERGRGIVERMAELVGDLLELSRIEAGSLGLEIESCSLAEICERAISPLAPLAAGRAIRLVTDLPPRIRTARVDRRRVEQIVANLAANACKFSPEGGLVEIVARVDGPVALVVVRDEGLGIDRTDLERVFRPFARLESHERIPGTGLGLPISRDLARAMGGDVAVASVPTSGSAFIVCLPATAEVPRGAVAAGLRGAIETEEIGLEERAVLNALRAGSAVADHPGGDRTGRGTRRHGESARAAERTDGGSRSADMPAVDAA